jgi:hypothetical protein
VPVDLTFRGVGPWGSGKGTNLQASEVDNNFWEVSEAILNLENNPALPTSIETISISGTQMYITLTNGDVLGPYTLPVLVMRWRDEWLPNTPYTSLDVFKVTDVGIFLVELDHTSGDTFDPDITSGGEPALMQLFGSTDASLSGLSDVEIASLAAGDALFWNGAAWVNIHVGNMAYQESSAVSISGGTITGLPSPTGPNDAATKGYVDGAVAGAPSIASNTILSNVAVGPAAPVANTLSDILDAALGSTVVGNLIFRGGSGWQVLPPGLSGYILQSNGAGVSIAWVPAPGAGVVSVTAGSGLVASPSPIVSSGSLALATIADSRFLANITGGTAAPSAQSLSSILDHIVSTARGTILTRTGAGWVGLAPGTSGYYLKTQGAGSDLLWDAPAGSGTVVSVGSGAGLTGGPITSTGSLSLDDIADGTVLANVSGSTDTPAAVGISALLDDLLGTTQGSVAYRNNTAWVALTPGTSGQILTTGGAAANPSWQNAPITGAAIANLRIVANVSGSSAVPAANTLSDILDAILTSARGSIIYRTNTGWTALAPGTSGQVLQSGGGAGDPSWVTNGGGSIAISSPAGQDVLVYNSSSGKFENQRPKYNIGAYIAGGMVGSQNLLFHKFSKAVTLPANLGAFLGHTSEAGAGTAATASAAITLAKAVAATPTSFSTVATITFAGGAVVGTFSTQAAITFAQGDVLRVRGPATPDATLADFMMTLVGYET